jgi:DNA-binding MarR family transcriptional regulator
MQDDRLRRSAGHALARAFRRMNRSVGRALRPHGVSAEQAHVLSVLWLEGPMTLGELQRALELSSPTLTGAVQRMEQAGMVHRTTDEADRRVSRILPPDWPAAKKRRVLAAIDDAERAALAGLSQREQATLYALLERVDVPARRGR